MRFFKYFFFLILILITSNSFAEQACFWKLNGKDYREPDEACADNTKTFDKFVSHYPPQNGYCRYVDITNSIKTTTLMPVYSCENVECPTAGSSISAVANESNQLPKRLCMPHKTIICQFDAKPNPFIVNMAGSGRPSIELYSNGSEPDPSCKEAYEGSCNPEDPYGGCFTPPDDNCTRQSDGSIICPEEKKPEIGPTCNGSTYCNRPPQGCGEGYVSGSFNGQQLCIKTSKSDGTGTGTGGDGSGTGTGGDGSGTGTGGDGSGTGTGGDGSGTGTGTNTSTSTSTSTSSSSDGSTIVNIVNNITSTVNIDVSSIVNAVDKVTQKLTWLKNELAQSLNDVKKSIDGTNDKIDTTNNKLDAIKTSSDSINSKLDQTNSSLNDISSKLNNLNSSNGSDTGSTDLTETNSLLKSIKDFITGDPGEPEQNEIGNLELTEKNFSTRLISVGSSSCPSDKNINWSTPFGTFNKTISYQNLCSSSAWLGYLFVIIAYVYGAIIIARDT